jgi:hypothetical protein
MPPQSTMMPKMMNPITAMILMMPRTNSTVEIIPSTQLSLSPLFGSRSPGEKGGCDLPSP